MHIYPHVYRFLCSQLLLAFHLPPVDLISFFLKYILQHYFQVDPWMRKYLNLCQKNDNFTLVLTLQFSQFSLAASSILNSQLFLLSALKVPQSLCLQASLIGASPSVKLSSLCRNSIFSLQLSLRFFSLFLWYCMCTIQCLNIS